jgi:hypothetical protein
VDGRSAKELAKAWFPVPGAAVIPPELLSILSSSCVLGSVELSDGKAEVVVTFDSIKRGNIRNCDLLIQGICRLGKITISIEAKVNEDFGGLVWKKLYENRNNQDSKRPERIYLLAKALFGGSIEEICDF